jgi:hypothetical protein
MGQRVEKKSEGTDFLNVKHVVLVQNSSMMAFLCDDASPFILNTVAPSDSTKMCSLKTWSKLEESKRFAIC